ncbi:MAG TPA: bifunctional 3-(3-hydroxy-phenyl)propionate/3-hydroxycinnamic acid hydroxylase [Streptomyces sp.]|nr:bifunctional 3-(3-hydroxy-phenyl)propionate/3-hydroxycinnamic acid hydroxylase [Streptomyces sp.]
MVTESTCPSQVVVVGYGPVGQVLSHLLARNGHRTTVVEKWPRPYPLPRAVSFDGHAGRILAGTGVSDALAPHCRPSPDYEIDTADGRTLLRIPLAARGRHGWPDSTSVYQPGLEAALAERNARLDALRLLRGWEAVDVADCGDEGARVTARDAATGELRTFRGAFVVGCDGAGSLVRRSLGTPMTDRGFELDWMACDVVPHRPADFPPRRNLQIADPARPRVVVPAGPGHRRWEFMRLPAEPYEEFATLANAWRMLEACGVSRDAAELQRHAVYRLGARNAVRWRAGNLLIAGDAAHQMPPFVGQGMCSGIRDAANLAWKLDLVLAGKAGGALLDSYGRERRPQVQGVVDMSVRLGRLICETDPHAAARRDEAMLAARAADTAGPSTEDDSAEDDPSRDALTGGFLRLGADGRPSAPAGRLAPQARVAAAGRSGLLDDVVGRGFVLLTRDDPAELLHSDLLRSLALLGVRPVWLRPAGTGDGAAVVDVDGRYLRWLSGLNAVAVLVRPDFYLYGAGRDAADTEAMLGGFLQQLAPAPAASGAAPAH